MVVLDLVIRLADFIEEKLAPPSIATHSIDDVVILDAHGCMRLNYRNRKVQHNINKHLACLSKIEL